MYTNEMRHAVRAIKNPAPLHVDVAENNGTISLVISREGLQKLDKKQLADFKAYVRQVVGIIELGGGGRVNVVTV